MNIHSQPYGVGMSYRYILQEGILKNKDAIDLIEIATEDYVIRRRRLDTDPDESLLHEITTEIPAVAHGISLSFGSAEPLPQDYLEQTKRLMERHHVEVFSEHLAFHRMDGNDLAIFLAMPHEEVVISFLKKQYEAIREVIGRPFALENVTYYFPVPNDSMDEAAFLTRLTEETDCSLLLDVTNVYNNSYNHGYDAMEFLDRLPLDRVSQIHLAGGELRDGKWEDCHNSPVMEPVWEILDEVLRRSPANIVILERDSNFAPFDLIMEDIHKAREIFYKNRPAKPSGDGVQWDFPVTDWGRTNVPDFEGEEFRNLRGYQQAVMKRITSEDFRSSFEKTPDLALDQFKLDPEWKERVKNCDPKSMSMLAHSWEGMCKETAMLDAEHEQREWAAWGHILSQEEASVQPVVL